MADKALLDRSAFIWLIPLLLTLLVVMHATACAASTLVLHLDSIAGQDWSARGIAIEIEPHVLDANQLTLKIDQIILPNQVQEIQNVRVECPRFRVGSKSLSCQNATARLDHPQVSPTAFTVTFDYRYAGPVSGSFINLPLAGGSLSGQFSWHAPRWSVSAQGKGFRLHDINNLLGNALRSTGFELAGELDLDLDGKGDTQGVREFDITASAGEMSFTDPSSLRVGEKLGLLTALNARRAGQNWRFDVELGVLNGQLYVDPLYMEVEPARPVKVTASGLWNQNRKRLQIDALSYHHPNVIHASGRGKIHMADSPRLLSGHAELISARLPGLYTVYLQPFLIGTVADELQTAGGLSGEFDFQGRDQGALRLKLDSLHLNDAQGRFAINGLQGEVNWSSHNPTPATRLSLQGAKLYKIELGAAKLDLQSVGHDLHLLKPTVVPMFDGQLRLASLAAENIAKKDLSWRFDAGLTPVSMELLTEAFGWPTMSGKLSGMIPDVSYKGGKLVVGGALLVRVFEGSIVVNKLRMHQPLGVVPMLSADVDVFDLDLEALTRTFSFGKIQGRLEGHIKGLRLIDWQPVQFDARFATPQDDPSRHRISQRAIDDLTSIGGGMGGALSSGFMSFFEDFSYERIGLSCRLSNGVCQMDGISPAEKGGYYIVKGWGLPRIDVIGYSHRVDWFELVERLKNIQLEHAPVVR